MDLLKDLSSPQREAVTHTRGPLLVLAGAGSGKTRVLTHRIAHLIGTLKVRPYNILAVTFTNKAAAEMRDRVVTLIGDMPTGLWLGTFHSACVRLLRENAKLLGYPKSFVIYDQTDQLNLIKKVMGELDISERVFNPKGVRERISWLKANVVPPREHPQMNPFEEVVSRVYQKYEERCRDSGALDFDDLLMKTVELLEGFPSVLDTYSKRFRHILVDEYQDTNHAQYLIVKLLSAKHRKLCVVGDDDQSIYSFRGADPTNILDFEKDFPDAKVVRLEQNYRSSQNILTAASSVVRRNLGRKGKELWTRKETGELIDLFEALNEKEEADWILSAIRKEVSNRKRSLRDFVVLYRTNAQSRVLEESFRSVDIPYVIVGGIRFYERKEVKDILAYLKVLQNPADQISLSRILNTPRRGIGEKTLERLSELASSKSIFLYEAAERAEEVEGLSPRARSALLSLSQLLKSCRRARKNLTISELTLNILDETGYFRELEEEGTVEAEGRIENIRELLASMDDFSNESKDSSLEAYLAKISLLTDIDDWDDREEAVTLMTAHNAKGLEFPAVFISGLEEGLFPHFSSLHSTEELEEERRLFYVGLTRAKEKVYLSHAVDRRRFRGTPPEPSRFLAEIPEGLLRRKPGKRPLGIGDRVYHHLWGFAEVVDLGGEGKGQKATLLLDDGEEKRVMVRYAKLEVINF